MPIRRRIAPLTPRRCLHGVSCGISRGFPRLYPCGGQVAYVLLTRAPVAGRRIAAPPLPLDLHVLSLSLAFILSQDQTLHSKNFLIFIFFLSPVIGPLGINSSRTRTCCLFQTFQYLKELRSLCPESGCKDKANYSIPPNNLSSFFQNNFTICHNTLIYTKINITSRQNKKQGAQRRLAISITHPPHSRSHSQMHAVRRHPTPPTHLPVRLKSNIRVIKHLLPRGEAYNKKCTEDVQAAPALHFEAKVAPRAICTKGATKVHRI